MFSFNFLKGQWETPAPLHTPHTQAILTKTPSGPTSKHNFPNMSLISFFLILPSSLAYKIISKGLDESPSIIICSAVPWDNSAHTQAHSEESKISLALRLSYISFLNCKYKYTKANK